MREGDVVPPPPPLAAPGGPAQPSPRERRAGSQRGPQPFSLREKDTEPLRGRLLPRSEPRVLAPHSRLPEPLRKTARRNQPGPPGAILHYGSHARGGRHFAPESEPRAAALRSPALGAAILGYGSPSAYP